MLLRDVGDWSPTDRRSGCLSRSFSGADAGGALLKRRAPAKSTTSPHAPARAAESLQCDQDVRQQCALGPAKSASRRRSLSAKTGQFAPRCAATPPVEWLFAQTGESRGCTLKYFAYNFIKFHRTLRMSPAMAAGVMDRLWSVEDLAALLESYEQRRAERAA
jgi:hypothetical protein